MLGALASKGIEEMTAINTIVVRNNTNWSYRVQVIGSFYTNDHNECVLGAGEYYKVTLKCINTKAVVRVWKTNGDLYGNAKFNFVKNDHDECEITNGGIRFNGKSRHTNENWEAIAYWFSQEAR